MQRRISLKQFSIVLFSKHFSQLSDCAASWNHTSKIFSKKASSTVLYGVLQTRSLDRFLTYQMLRYTNLYSLSFFVSSFFRFSSVCLVLCFCSEPVNSPCLASCSRQTKESKTCLSGLCRLYTHSSRLISFIAELARKLISNPLTPVANK